MVWLWSLAHARVAIVVQLDKQLHVSVGISNAICYSLSLATRWFSTFLLAPPGVYQHTRFCKLSKWSTQQSKTCPNRDWVLSSWFKQLAYIFSCKVTCRLSKPESSKNSSARTGNEWWSRACISGYHSGCLYIPRPVPNTCGFVWRHIQDWL